MQRPVVNTEEGSNPGAPLAWGSPENPDDAVAGYGYVPCDTSEVEETFYYHSDHLGSTSYITDQQANVTQYDAYLPYGELLVDEHSSSADLPYKFNGKELDEETGLYYYGARYMNPVTSMWYGVDPLTEKYPNVSAFVYCMGNPVKFVDPNGMKPNKKEAALMSSIVYDDHSNPDLYKKHLDALKRTGWGFAKEYEIVNGKQRVVNGKLQEVNGKVHKYENTGFKYATFVRTNRGKKEYCVAFAGTDLTGFNKETMKDVGTDILNFLGIITHQHASAIATSLAANGIFGKYDLSFTGHSLGGSLATVASLMTGKDAIIFNSASVAGMYKDLGFILSIFRGGKRGFITHYRSMGSLGYFNGDPVNLGQDFSFHEVNGLCIPVRTKDNFSHGINDIIDAFNKK